MSLKQSSFCHFCGEKLRSRYFKYDNGLVVCERCNTSEPRCSQCNIPSHQLMTVRGVPICPTCLQKASKCACCHEPILHKYFIIGDSPLHFCDTCVATRSRCDICRVPLDDQGKTFPARDGNTYRCASCLRSAVTTYAEAEQLYRNTNTLLKQELLLNVVVLPKLSVVERATLVTLHKGVDTLNSSDMPLGAEQQHLLGFFRRIGEGRDIYIEQMLPQTLFQAVAAHELAHAWQSTHSPSTQSLKVVEGFAEWVAYRVLLILGQQPEAARLTRRHDLYGEGLQYFIELERQRGRQGVIQQAMQA